MAGWAGVQNGNLLRRIAGNYKAFVTIDGNLAHQQNIPNLPFGVVVLGGLLRIGLRISDLSFPKFSQLSEASDPVKLFGLHEIGREFGSGRLIPGPAPTNGECPFSRALFRGKGRSALEAIGRIMIRPGFAQTSAAREMIDTVRALPIRNRWAPSAIS